MATIMLLEYTGCPRKSAPFSSNTNTHKSIIRYIHRYDMQYQLIYFLNSHVIHIILRDNKMYINKRQTTLLKIINSNKTTQ